MPWGVGKRGTCPPSKPWAVYRQAAGGQPEKVMACHYTKERAQAHQRALYANEPTASSVPGQEQAMPEQFIVPLEQKALTDGGHGEISGLASVYGNIDLQDDEMQRGAADRSIAHQKTARSKLPLLDWHGESLSRLIGSVQEMTSVPQGVWFKAAFSGTPEAQRARQLAREGHLGGVSIGYLPVRSSYKTVDGRPVRMLHEVKLLEISLTPVPANPLAQVASVKAASQPYGDVPYADPGYLDRDGNQVSKSGKPGVKRYPVDEGRVMAAWSYINQEKNAAQYTAEQLAAIKGRIRSAMAKFGHQVSESSLDFEQFTGSMRAALDITFEPARKAVVDLLTSAYHLTHQAPGTDDDPDPTAGAPAPGQGTAETPPSDAAVYAAQFLGPPGPRDGAPDSDADGLAYPQRLLESVKDQAAIDALEAQINQALGRAAQ